MVCFMEKRAKPPRYEVLTWDPNRQEYTPQSGIPTPVVGWVGLLRAVRALRQFGYTAHRRKHTGESDAAVSIDRLEESQP